LGDVAGLVADGDFLRAHVPPGGLESGSGSPFGSGAAGAFSVRMRRSSACTSKPSAKIFPFSKSESSVSIDSFPFAASVPRALIVGASITNRSKSMLTVTDPPFSFR
jgi:hypothetical protein